jgi:hypothetical protein
VQSAGVSILPVRDGCVCVALVVVYGLPDDERTKNSFVALPLLLDFMFLRRHIEATTRAPDLKFSPSRNIAMSFALAALPPNYYAATAVHVRIENWEMIHSIPIDARCEFCGVCLCGGRLTR